MRRPTLFALVLLAACGGAPAAITVPTAAPATTAAEVTTTAPATTTAPTSGTATTVALAATTTVAPAATTTVPRVRPEGRDAPDFTLALGEGGTLTLSEEHRPVFLLFWAEW